VVNRAPIAFASAAWRIHVSFTLSHLSFFSKAFQRGNDHGTSQPAYGRTAIRARRSFAGNPGGFVVRVLGGDARPDAGAAVPGLARRLTRARPDG